MEPPKKIEQMEKGKSKPNAPTKELITDDESDSSDTKLRRHTDNFTLKNLLLTIPDFDGKSVPVESFIHQIEFAKKHIQKSKRELLLSCILGAKIKGQAQFNIRADAINTFSDLKRLLRQNYGSHQNLQMYQLQRFFIKQGTRESVLDYTRRFTKIQDAALNAVAIQDVPETTKTILIDVERKNGLSDYIQGLKQEFRFDVKLEKPNDVNAAIQLAIQAEIIYKTKHLTITRCSKQNRTFSKKSFKRTKPSKTRDQGNFIKCTYCKRFGHTIEECRTKRYHEQRNFQKTQHTGKDSKPQQEKERISKEIHENKIRDHYSSDRTVEKLRTSYNWSGMIKDTGRVIKECPTLNKMGPLSTDKENAYIIAAQDYYKRCVQFAPLRTKEAKDGEKTFQAQGQHMGRIWAI